MKINDYDLDISYESQAVLQGKLKNLEIDINRLRIAINSNFSKNFLELDESELDRKRTEYMYILNKLNILRSKERRNKIRGLDSEHNKDVSKLARDLPDNPTLRFNNERFILPYKSGAITNYHTAIFDMIAQ